MGLYISEIEKNGSIAIEDSILVKGYTASYGSKMLENFVAPFDAEAVARLKDAGYSISGKTNVGEFGLDLAGETSAFESGLKETLASPTSLLVKEGKVLAALSVDVNGAPRRGAAFSKVNCVKPTYGTVSRYGVIPCACSGEQICVTAKDVETTTKILSTISGNDKKDGTSVATTSFSYSCNKDVKGKKIAIVKELFDLADDTIKSTLTTFGEQLSSLGVTVETISVPEVLLSKTAWYILSCAETYNNLARYDGVKFGHRAKEYKTIDELYKNSRTEGFGLLTKATILYGSDVLSKERYINSYDKAMRVRGIVQTTISKVLEDFDCLLMPATSKEAFSLSQVQGNMKLVFDETAFTSLANLTGMPAMVTGGVQLMGNLYEEDVLLSIASAVERRA